MGENAKRITDGAVVKIGTCESMYYLRFEDRKNVRAIPGNVNPGSDEDAGQLRFRVPFPDEDAVKIGEYAEYARGARLYRTGERGYTEDYSDPELAEQPGIIQLTHPSGLLVNVPCYHGEKLPTVPKESGVGFHWNGKSHALELGMIRGIMVDGALVALPVVRCRHCGGMWRSSWEKLWDYIPADLRAACEQYRTGAESVAAK
jgi:hypothetical protein